jgi:putative transposase
VRYGQLRQDLGEVFRRLAEQKESRIEEGHLPSDHVHIMISIPPKYAVAQVIGFTKGKSAIHLARVYGGRKQNYAGQNFWARGYFVSTVGRDEVVIREYIRSQEREDKRLDQLGGRETNSGNSVGGTKRAGDVTTRCAVLTQKLSKIDIKLSCVARTFLYDTEICAVSRHACNAIEPICQWATEHNNQEFSHVSYLAQP